MKLEEVKKELFDIQLQIELLDARQRQIWKRLEEEGIDEDQMRRMQ
jgi:hypothetical protein